MTVHYRINVTIIEVTPAKPPTKEGYNAIPATSRAMSEIAQFNIRGTELTTAVAQTIAQLDLIAMYNDTESSK